MGSNLPTLILTEVLRNLYEPGKQDYRRTLPIHSAQKKLIMKRVDGQLAPSQTPTLLMALGRSPHTTTIDWLIQTCMEQIYH